jgi:hypothetical protein
VSEKRKQKKSIGDDVFGASDSVGVFEEMICLCCEDNE